MLLSAKKLILLLSNMLVVGLYHFLELDTLNVGVTLEHPVSVYLCDLFSYSPDCCFDCCDSSLEVWVCRSLLQRSLNWAYIWDEANCVGIDRSLWVPLKCCPGPKSLTLLFKCSPGPWSLTLLFTEGLSYLTLGAFSCNIDNYFGGLTRCLDDLNTVGRTHKSES